MAKVKTTKTLKQNIALVSACVFLLLRIGCHLPRFIRDLFQLLFDLSLQI